METDLIVQLGDAIRDVIDTYNTGHEIPVPLIVGLLHCIAHEVIIDNFEYEDIWDDGYDDEDEEDF